jgi:hypothetical protein
MYPSPGLEARMLYGELGVRYEKWTGNVWLSVGFIHIGFGNSLLRFKWLFQIVLILICVCIHTFILCLMSDDFTCQGLVFNAGLVLRVSAKM